MERASPSIPNKENGLGEKPPAQKNKMIKKTDENEFNAMIVFGNFEMKGIERIGIKKGTM